MSDDVLTHWAHGIAEAEMMSDLPGGDPWAAPMHCIRDLAAALRAERERLAELEKQHTDDDVRFALHLNRAMAAEEKSALAEMRAIGQKAHIEAVEAKVAELREALSGHRDLDQTYALTDAEKRIAELQARVAELEPDAKLGRMVREMPVEQRLIHTVYGDWWYGRNVRGEFGATGASPEAALEAARKEEP